MAKKEYTYDDICKDIRKKNFAPIYTLMGEEPYLIDGITNLIIDHALTEEQRDFNQRIFYGVDSSVSQVIDAARRFPLMADRQLIVVREAQQLECFEDLAVYVKNPSPSTILVLNYKYKNLDRRKSITTLLADNGVLFEAKKVADYRMAAYISGAVAQKGLTIDSKASQMMADFIGNDLQTLEKELEKLAIVLQNETQKRITSDLVERNVGISKEYNNFELLKAIITKDVLKANRIASHFNSNPKANPIQVTLTVLFNYFSNLLICFYSKDKSEMGLVAALGLRGTFQAKDYLLGMKTIGAMKAFRMIHEIRMVDAQSKGVDNATADSGELMKSLLYKMLH